MKPGIAKNIKLHPIDSLFGAESEGISIVELPLLKLHTFKNHPFQVNQDEEMENLVKSVKQGGVLQPIIVRTLPDDVYEIISGHRRVYASKLAGKTTIPAIINELDDDEATIYMVDTNLQREKLLFSEKAFAYKMKLEAMKRKAGRPVKNVSQVGTDSFTVSSAVQLSEETGESRNQIFRFIRLTELIKPLLDMTDSGKLPFNTAVELSYLSKHFQEILTGMIEQDETIPSMKQAQGLKKYFQEDKLTIDMMCVLLKDMKQETLKVTLKSDTLKKYFSKEYTPRQIEEVVIRLLENWQNEQKK